MKKFFLLAVIVISLTTTTKAQDEGKVTFDLNFQPAAFFDASAGDMFTMPYIKARYFMASDVALRVGLGLSLSSEKDYDGTSDDYDKQSSFGLIFAPGIEKHFGSEKFFAYIGAELPIGLNSNKTEYVTGPNTIKSTGGYTTIGVNAVIGCDFYIFKNFYVGAELTPGFAFRKNKDSKTDGTVTNKGGSESNFSLGSSSGLRIGFRF